MFLSTLTLGALEDSVLTVIDQRGTDAHPTVTPDGYATAAIFRRWISADGARALFVQKTPEDMGKALRGASDLARGEPPLPQLGTIRAMIAFCRAHGIRLTFLIPPMPAALLEIFDQAGLWPDFIRWQQALVAALPANGSVTLWDFAGWNRYAIEPEPVRPGQRTRWFWELTHFTPALGARMIARMNGGGDPGFGIVLTRASLQGWRAAQQRANLAYACGRDPAPLLAPWPSPPRYASPCAGARAAAHRDFAQPRTTPSTPTTEAVALPFRSGVSTNQRTGYSAAAAGVTTQRSPITVTATALRSIATRPVTPHSASASVSSARSSASVTDAARR